jgi:hypothetical protein
MSLSFSHSLSECLFSSCPSRYLCLLFLSVFSFPLSILTETLSFLFSFLYLYSAVPATGDNEILLEVHSESRNDSLVRRLLFPDLIRRKRVRESVCIVYERISFLFGSFLGFFLPFFFFLSFCLSSSLSVSLFPVSSCLSPLSVSSIDLYLSSLSFFLLRCSSELSQRES